MNPWWQPLDSKTCNEQAFPDIHPNQRCNEHRKEDIIMLYWKFRQLVCLLARVSAKVVKTFCLGLVGYFALTALVCILLNQFGGPNFKFTALTAILLFSPLNLALGVLAIYYSCKKWVWNAFETYFLATHDDPNWEEVEDELRRLALRVHVSLPDESKKEILLMKRTFRDKVAIANARFGAPNFSHKISVWVKARKGASHEKGHF